MLTETQVATEIIVDSHPWLRIAPPVLAIGLAVILKDVNFALLLAVLAGCLILADFSAMESVEHFCDVFVAQVANAEHASVVLFTILLGSMIGLINDSKGTLAVVGRIAKYANTRRKGQVATWLAGVVVFFDDYANTMLIGGSVRPLTDKLKISRAKLAFLVYATAAPIAGLALSTWTAVELGYVEAGLTQANMGADVTDVFLGTIPYRIYPIIAIIFVGVIAYTGKDFGPMLKAEREANLRPAESEVTATNGTPASMWSAIIPVAVLLITVISLLARDYFKHGEAILANPGAADKGWLASVDSYRLLLITSLAASAAAIVSAMTFGKMKLAECSESWTKGVTSMIPAVIVLILAWAIGAICDEDKLSTANYITSLIGDSVRPQFLPAIAFIASGAIAVSVGSSFATMGLLVPMFIPMAASILGQPDSPVSPQDPVFLATVGAILAGAIFGDHCSPISDTTVLSSAASGCDHLHHVATQVPYSIVIAVASLLFGYLPIGFGVPWWIALPLSTSISVGAIIFFGQTPEQHVAKPQSDK